MFLDNNKSYSALDAQFKELIRLAKHQGSAVGIGHPYPETLRYLQKNLSRLKAAGIELVPVSALLDLPHHAERSPITPSVVPATVNKTPARPTKPHTPAPELVEQQLAAEEIVTPVELQPWRIPYRIDSIGLVAPSVPETCAESYP